MNFSSVFPWLGRLQLRSGKESRLKQLQLQRHLLHHGLETTAEVMGATLSEETAGRLLAVKLWLKLRQTDGSYIYTHTQTMVSLNHVPGKGATVRIKYLPENLSQVLIL